MTDASSTTRAASMAIAGGILFALSVAAELVFPVQNSDGSSREPLLHAVYLAAWIVGVSLIGAMALGLRALPTGGGRSRKASIGSWLVLAGAAAFAVSGLGQLIGVLAGVQLDAFFVLFLVAFPLLVIGFVLLGLAMRGAGGPVWILAFVAAAGFLVALLAEADPWHDIGLLTGAVAVAGFGVALRLRADTGTEVPIG